jgi:flagellin
MPITLSNNGSVQQASYHLADAQEKFQMSIRRLASGKRIVGPNEDPGTLAVSMKVRASVERLVGAQNNVRSGIGFLEVQDGLLETAGRILMRMSELKGYSTQDPLKSVDDTASYNNEFEDLQFQLYDISQMKFNKQYLFADTNTNDGGDAYFGGSEQDDNYANLVSIHTSSEGSGGSTVDIHRSLFLSALVIENSETPQNAWEGSNQNGGADDTTWKTVAGTDAASSTDLATGYVALAKDSSDSDHTALTLDNVRTETLEAAIENIVFLRAQTGGGMSRLQFAMDSIATQETNMRSALGRIEDVDMAAESANLAKYGILMQASAAMVTQANLSNEVALTLVRGM